MCGVLLFGVLDRFPLFETQIWRPGCAADTAASTAKTCGCRLINFSLIPRVISSISKRFSSEAIWACITINRKRNSPSSSRQIDVVVCMNRLGDFVGFFQQRRHQRSVVLLGGPTGSPPEPRSRAIISQS